MAVRYRKSMPSPLPILTAERVRQQLTGRGQQARSCRAIHSVRDARSVHARRTAGEITSATTSASCARHSTVTGVFSTRTSRRV